VQKPERFLIMVWCECNVCLSEETVNIEEYILVAPHRTRIFHIGRSDDMPECIREGPIRGVEHSFSKTTGDKTLEFGGVSSSNDLTRYKIKSFYFYLI
jgi:hypothetical protein